jgi:hypothetical protein
MKRQIAVMLVIYSWATAMGQTDQMLQQAIQVVRDWLNNPQAEVEFMFHSDRSSGLGGSVNDFHFETPYYIREIIVNLDKMKVVGWDATVNWVEEAKTDLPMKSEAEIIQIARNYAQQHFPHFHEFSEWETTIEPFDLSEISNKQAIKYIVSFSPIVTNGAGTKIPVLTTVCAVDIDPYEGRVIGYYERHMPMTITNLIPNFSPEEAKRRIEQAFLNLGAAQASATMSLDIGLLNGLVIGATQTSGLRLAYLFDSVITVGKPGYEEEFGTEEEPQEWQAAIDAHTGELFYRVPILGSVDEKAKERLLHNSQYRNIPLLPITRQQWWLIVGILIIGCLILFWVKRIQGNLGEKFMR